MADLILNDKVMITDDGGFATRLTNKTGGATVKGYVVQPNPSQDNSFVLIDAAGDPDPIGIVYEAGVADGGECWIVYTGIAEVFCVATATRGQFVRTGASTDSNEEAGKAVAENVPTSPFATDKHFQELGHVLETHNGAGLARCILHFN